MIKKIVILFLYIGLPLTYYSYAQLNKEMATIKRDNVKFILTSSAFKNMSEIPKKYTCEGKDISPPLSWSGVPKNTKSFVLLCDDPDAPTEKPFVHWVVYNIPPDITHFAEGISFADLAVAQGKNDFNNSGYNGPCPPKNHGMHHYQFTLYALAINTNLKMGATKDIVLQAIQGHVLGKAELIGLFERVE